jgi:polyhydroxyalkanoate synthesis repressor PhaR
MQVPTIVIRKYENRRLYDTANSRYVNLNDVAGMLRDGMNVQVVDSATGEDITRLILTQIIVENAKDGESALSLDILKQIVMATGRAGQETISKYTRSIFDLYQTAYRAFAPAVFPLDLIQAVLQGRPPGAGPDVISRDEHAVMPQDAGARDDKTEIQELKRRIDQLERAMAALQRVKPARKRRRPRH